MSSKQPRKHHFVQAAHLDCFTNTNGLLHVYGKDGSKFHGTPESLFKQKDLNSYQTPEGLDTSFERFVTDIENMTFPAVRRIIDGSKIIADELVDVTAYLALSAMRNPSVQSGIVEHRRQVAEIHTRMMDRRGGFKELGPYPLGDGKSLERLIDDKEIIFEISNSVYLEALFDLSKGLHAILLNGYGWSLLKSHKDRVVVCDHPLTIVHPGMRYGAYGIPPGGADAEVAFPLSKSLYLIGKWEDTFDESDSEDAVDELNKRQAIYANRHIVACHERRCFQDLALRYRTVGFQTKAEILDAGHEAYQVVRRGVFPFANGPARRSRFELGDQVRKLEKLI